MFVTIIINLRIKIPYMRWNIMNRSSKNQYYVNKYVNKFLVNFKSMTFLPIETESLF